jgi:hypothetical protein
MKAGMSRVEDWETAGFEFDEGQILFVFFEGIINLHFALLKMVFFFQPHDHR